MPEYIEREATVKLLRSIGSRDYRREEGTLADAIKMVMHSEYTPTADVEPVRHGRWEDYWGGKYSDPLYVCSECHKPALLVRDLDDVYFETMKQRRTQFCPHCGAKMDKEDKPDAK